MLLQYLTCGMCQKTCINHSSLTRHNNMNGIYKTNRPCTELISLTGLHCKRLLDSRAIVVLIKTKSTDQILSSIVIPRKILLRATKDMEGHDRLRSEMIWYIEEELKISNVHSLCTCRFKHTSNVLFYILIFHNSYRYVVIRRFI